MKNIVGTLCLLGVMLIAGCGKRDALKRDVTRPSFRITESKPHVCFVNVGKDVSQDAFDHAVSNACEMTQIRWVTEQIPTVRLEDVVVPFSEQCQQFSPATVLVVYVVNDPDLPKLMSAPGQYALINMCAMRNDSPTAEVFTGRLIRILMKGLAYAAGVGVNQDPICVMCWNSFTLKTIDATSATYGPQAYFVLCDILKAAGTKFIFRNAE